MNIDFQVLNKLILNNWHYIDKKVLNFHSDINFFTGHSGSGKSTVIDALQMVLYADTDGVHFFNKAAKENSDRTLMEYLRGMIDVKDNDVTHYTRNQNFSSNIVLEFYNTEEESYQCVGVAFDVEIDNPKAEHLFFWHKGPAPAHYYRKADRCITISELKEELKSNFAAADFFITGTNERFRHNLYENYLGGINSQKFIPLFKKAISFHMNISLEEFVKEYICIEKDIHLEDMQDSVTQYAKLKRRIIETQREIEALEKIQNVYSEFDTLNLREKQYGYYVEKLEIIMAREEIQSRANKIQDAKNNIEFLEREIEKVNAEAEALKEKRDSIVVNIHNTGYGDLKESLHSKRQLIEKYNEDKRDYDKIAQGLTPWLAYEWFPEKGKKQISAFRKYAISDEEIEELKQCLCTIQEKQEKKKIEIEKEYEDLKQKLQELNETIGKNKIGNKAYPKNLQEVKVILSEKLWEKYAHFVPVEILADMIEIKDETWRNAVEGYLSNNRFNILVPPEYAQDAMEIYALLPADKYGKISVVDTEKVLESKAEVKENSLAEEIETEFNYAKVYIEFLLGNVIKCSAVQEMRQNKIGITKECLLYKGFKLGHIDKKKYTDTIYIGIKSVDRNLSRNIEQANEMRERINELRPVLAQYKEISKYESLNKEVERVKKYKLSILNVKTLVSEVAELEEKLSNLREGYIDNWINEEKELSAQMKLKQSQEKELASKKGVAEQNCCLQENQRLIDENNLILLENKLVVNENYDIDFEKELLERKPGHFEKHCTYFMGEKNKCAAKALEVKEKLVEARNEYAISFSYRNFNITNDSNIEYDRLLEELKCDKLEVFREKAEEQAQYAVEHFKNDFIYKIRTLIKEARQQKDELNRVLNKMDFGKEKYQFIITKNKGYEGKFYDMFMSESLDVNPTLFQDYDPKQVNLFSMEQEKNYGDEMNELIDIFIPADNATAEEIEEARRNMEKYSDYRTYLSFDMEQIIGGSSSKVSKTLSKNSGGEGQNPIYIALLASFAQIYRINLLPKARRRATMRLVILDEAFSKMDAEKVASCIGLMRKLGFQAIISSTNDKIQNYLDNVNKAFIFANPNKKYISIQPFERKEFEELLDYKEDGESL